MKTKYPIIGGVVLIAIVAMGLYFNAKGEKTNDSESKAVEEEQIKNTKVKEIPNALEGELKISNDLKKGNLMLLLKESDRVIYFHTTRDFSNLLGKQVQANIDGSLDDFVLVDIVSK